MPSSQLVAPSGRTLAGRRIAITRPVSAPYSPAPYLEAQGAEPVAYPCVELHPPVETAPVHQALRSLRSPRNKRLLLPTLDSVLAVAERLAELGTAAPSLAAVRCAVYGALAYTAAVDLLGVTPLAVADAATHAALVTAMSLAARESVSIIQAAGARTDWPALIAQTGAKPHIVPAYRAVMPHHGEPLPSLLWSGVIDAILFLADTDVRYFAARLKHDGGTLAMLDHVCVACLDPQTAAAARAFNLRVDVVPAQHTPTALVEAIAAVLA